VKILYIHTFPERRGHGGAEETLWTLMCAIRDAGHQCVLLATSAERGLTRSEQDGITVWKAGIRNLYWPDTRKRRRAPVRALWHLQDSYNPWMQGYVREVVRAERPDVASLHNLPGWSAATWGTLHRLGVPTVQVLHDYYSICPRSTMFRNGRNCTGQCRSCSAFRSHHRELSRKVTAVVGVSRYILDVHRHLGYFQGAPLQCAIHNVVDAGQIGLCTPMENRRGRPFRFGFIGGLQPAKGIEHLLNAFAKASINDTELWIAGDGEPAFVNRLHEHWRINNVRYLGRVKPETFYPSIDVLVVPSLWSEALGRVVFEAFAFGKPVVGSRRGGIPEMIIDGRNGLLFDPDRPAELVSRLQRAAADPAWVLRAGINAKADALPYLSVNTWAQKYLSLYKTMIHHAKDQQR